MNQTPIVETSRLRLRGRSIEDFPAYAEMWAHPVVARGVSGAPLSEEDAWIKFTRVAGMWSLLGYGFWLVEEKKTGVMIGEIGLADFKRTITPSLDGMPEFGWVLAPSAHGKGYAKEGVEAALKWGERKFPGTTFSCIINPDNEPSIRVAESFDFRCVSKAIYKEAEVLVFHRLPQEPG